MPIERDLFEEEQTMVAMSFGDHIEELRLRLVLALLGLAAGIAVTLIPPLSLGQKVMEGMQGPARQALKQFHANRVEDKKKEAEVQQRTTPMVARISATAFAEALREVFPGLEAPSGEALAGKAVTLPMELRDSELIEVVEENTDRDENVLISLAPLETAIIFFTVCMVTGLVVASPWVFYQLWAFVAAGLYRHERKYVYKFMPFSIGLFLAGVLLCYFGVLPMTLKFLLQFNLWLGIQPNLRITEWMGFATVLPLVFGAGFQTPLVMLFVGKLGIVNATTFREKRKFALLGVVVAAAMLTPGPDVVSQLMLAVPMIALYELGIILVARAEVEAAKAEVL